MERLLIPEDTDNKDNKVVLDAEFSRCELTWGKGTSKVPYTPIENIDIHPIIHIRDKMNRVFDDDEKNPDNPIGKTVGIEYKWYRGPLHNVCCYHPHRSSLIQCTITQRCFCSTDCYLRSFSSLKDAFIYNVPIQLHHNEYVYGKAFARTFHSELKPHEQQDPLHGKILPNEILFDTSHYNSLLSPLSDKSPWVLISTDREYQPSNRDVGHTVLFEVSLCDLNHPSRKTTTRIKTGCVVPQLSIAPERRLIKTKLSSPLPSLPSIPSSPKIRVLSWNILADIYASPEAFPFCEPYVLSWAYRRDRILKELSQYQADIICLQEVQKEIYDEFLKPKFDAVYDAEYKAKTAGIFTVGLGKMRSAKMTYDGCATFFRRDRFRLLQSVAVEFSEEMKELLQAMAVDETSSTGSASKNIIKDNVALILLLEDIVEKKRLLVVNTHIAANPEQTDTKLWQTHILLNAVTKIFEERRSANYYDVPGLVMVGDFNSPPHSAVYSLLSTGFVPPSHPDVLKHKKMLHYHQILKEHNENGSLLHGLSLKSAYSMFGPWRRERGEKGERGERGGRLFADKTDEEVKGILENPYFPAPSALREPLFTNYTCIYVGCLDYLWYSDEVLSVVSVLEPVDESALMQESAVSYSRHQSLPSPCRASDHIVMMAEFEWNHSTPNSGAMGMPGPGNVGGMNRAVYHHHYHLQQQQQMSLHHHMQQQHAHALQQQQQQQQQSHIGFGGNW